MIEITIDTREQTPFHFPEFVKTTVGTLKTGDYAITGDKGFAVERKSLDDFLGTISSGWDRFQRELFRARDNGFVLPIIVEGDLDEVLFRYEENVEWIAAKTFLKNAPRGMTDSQKLESIRNLMSGDPQSRTIIPPSHNHFMLTPAFVLKRCGEIEHMGGHVSFCGRSAVAMCLSILTERWRILHEGEDNV